MNSENRRVSLLSSIPGVPPNHPQAQRPTQPERREELPDTGSCEVPDVEEDYEKPEPAPRHHPPAAPALNPYAGKITIARRPSAAPTPQVARGAAHSLTGAEPDILPADPDRAEENDNWIEAAPSEPVVHTTLEHLAGGAHAAVPEVDSGNSFGDRVGALAWAAKLRIAEGAAAFGQALAPTKYDDNQVEDGGNVMTTSEQMKVAVALESEPQQPQTELQPYDMGDKTHMEDLPIAALSVQQLALAGTNIDLAPMYRPLRRRADRAKHAKVEELQDLLKQDAQHVGEQPLEPYSLINGVQQAVHEELDRVLPPQITPRVEQVLKLFGAEHAKAAYMEGMEAVSDSCGDIPEEYRDVVPHLVTYGTNQSYRELAAAGEESGLDRVLNRSLTPHQATVNAFEALGVTPLFEHKGQLCFDGFAITQAIKAAKQSGRTQAIQAVKQSGLTPLVEFAETVSEVKREPHDIGTTHDRMAIVRDDEEQRYLVGWSPLFVQAPGTVKSPGKVPDRALIVRGDAVAMQSVMTDFVLRAFLDDGELRDYRNRGVGIQTAKRVSLVTDMSASDEWLTDPAKVGIRLDEVRPLEIESRRAES